MAKAKYQCNKCKQISVAEVPRQEHALQFGDKVTCSKCGTVGGMFKGSA